MIDYIGVKYSMHSPQIAEKKYPSNGFFKGAGWDILTTDIYISAHDSGYNFSCDDG